MLVIENTYADKHTPHWEFKLGAEQYSTRDVPERVTAIRKALLHAGGFRFRKGRAFPDSMFSDRFPYFDFLRTISQSLTDPATEIYPDLFPGDGAGLKPKNDPLWMALVCTDAVTPIMQGTYAAARGSAEAAMTAAEILKKGEEREIYALCRPSGHHAGPRVFGGYCYLNNAVLAADRLKERGKVAILDIDFHHGNGTQEFFWNDPQVLTCSIHCDPAVEYPYFWGYADETGGAEAPHSNLNLPLPKSADRSAYLDAVGKAVRAIKAFKADWLVISAGFDTFSEDPVGGFQLEVEDLAVIGSALGAADLPTLILQEGGYNLNNLGACVRSFLKGFPAERKQD